jgi:hypothetical protein
MVEEKGWLSSSLKKVIEKEWLYNVREGDTRIGVDAKDYTQVKPKQGDTI